MLSRVTAVFSFLVMLVVSGTLFAQTQTGTVTGRVTDQSDAVIPGVTVSVASDVLITGTRVTTTDASGNYSFRQLATGNYDVTFELSGFATTRHEQIAVEAFFVATVNVIMTVATVEEVITVTGESPTVDVKSSVLSTTVDRDLLDQVPSGKDIWVIAEQVPGVVQNKYNIGGTESAQQSKSFIHGASGQQEFAFDGLTNNWPGSNGAYVMVYFDYESFAEVQVVTSAAPAELGTSGLYMNMVTKSGGNDVHGGMTFSIEPGQWQGSNVDDALRAKGLTSGGNRIDRIYNFAPNVGGPIIKNKMWFFGSYLRYDVNTQVPGFTLADGSPEVDVNHQTNIMAKVTTQITDNNKLMGMYYFNYQNRFFRRPGGFVSQEASWRQIEPAHIVQGQWTSILPNETLLDARLGYVTHVFPLQPQDGVKPTDIARKDTGTNTSTVANELYRWHTAPRTQFNISLAGFSSGLGGSHDWKIGGGFSAQHTFSDNTLNGDYSMRFYNGVPDEVRLFSEVTGQRDDYHIITLFVQDSWTIGERLTINPGLRMEKFRGFYPDQGSPANTFFPAVSFTKVDNVPNFTNIVPRFGLSYDLTGDGKTAFKGSFSKFTQLEGSRLTGAINPNSRRWEGRAWDDANGNNFAEVSEFGDVLSRGGGTFVSFDPETTRPLTYEATAGIEHELGRDLSVSGTYYHRKNYNYFNRINRAAPTSSFTPVDIVSPEGQTITVYNQDPSTVGLVDRVITSDGMSKFTENYNGIEFTGRKRLSNGWQLLAGYTYGISKGFNPNFNTDVNNPNNLVNMKDAHHDQDRTHMIKVNGTYMLPGGVSVSSNYRYYTGQPLTRTFSVSLNQGRVRVPAEPRGAYRFDNVSILDLRVAKRFTFDTWSIEGQFDMFNALNSNAVTRANTTIGPSFGNPVQILTPRILGVGMRLTF